MPAFTHVSSPLPRGLGETPGRSGVWAATTGFLLLWTTIFAQAQAQDRIPTFRTGVSTVLVDTLALDADGNPATGLTRDDFEIFEDGVRQTITTFDVTDWTSYVTAKTDGRPATDGASVNTYPRRFIFVFNRQGARFGWLNRGKRALREFIVESMAEGDEAMVIENGYSFKIVQEFRSTKENTLDSVRSLSQMVIDYPMGADRAAGQLYRDLESLGNTLEAIPGRKVLVLLSNELATFTGPGSRRSNEGFTLQRATTALNQANTTVYTIDLRGPESTLSLVGGLSPLATETGGRHFRNSIAFETPLRRLGRENQRYYLLSYIPSNPELDGKYRRIEVKVRKPSVEIVARRGYIARESATLVADGTEAEAASAPDERVAADERRSRVLPDALELTSYLLPTGTGSSRVPVSVALPPELLSTTEDRKLTLTVSKDDETLHTFEESVNLKRYFLVENVELDPGYYLLRVTLTANGSQLYQASTQIQVPAGFGERFGISSIVPVVAPDATNAISGDIPILPTTSLIRGNDAYLLFQVFAGVDRPSREVELTYTLFDEGDNAIDTGGKDGPMALGEDRPGGTPVILRIPMNELSPGPYRVDIRIEDRSLGRRAASEIELRIR